MSLYDKTGFSRLFLSTFLVCRLLFRLPVLLYNGLWYLLTLIKPQLCSPKVHLRYLLHNVRLQSLRPSWCSLQQHRRLLSRRKATSCCWRCWTPAGTLSLSSNCSPILSESRCWVLVPASGWEMGWTGGVFALLWRSRGSGLTCLIKIAGNVVCYYLVLKNKLLIDQFVAF